jgi:fructosamine-3-kinase
VTLPEAVLRSIEARVGPVRAPSPVSGGSINQALHVEVDGQPAFLKHNATAPPGFFAAEARGLDALRGVAGGPRIPLVLAVHDAADVGDVGVPDDPSWLLLEWLEPVPPPS